MMIRPRHFIIGSFLALSVVLAKDPPPPIPPPMAQAVSVSMYRGHTIDIPLRALGRTPSQLKFLIRSRPRYGTLGEIRIVDEKDAVISYTHDDKAGEGADTFLFAVQAADSPVSASASISITISEEAPVFRAEEAPNFGNVSIGASREDAVTIRNLGGGIIAGRLEADPPWKILDKPEYTLRRGQEQKIRLRFTPTEKRQYSGKLDFSHDHTAAVMLSGSGVPAFELKPSDSVELMTNDKDLSRSGVLRIRNHTERDQVMEITAPQQVTVPSQVTISAGEEAAIPFRTTPQFLGALNETLKLKSADWEASLPLHVFAARAVLKMDPTAGLDFGETRPGRRYHSEFRLSNEGGLDAPLILGLPTEISISPPAEALVLKSGETRTIEVFFEPGVAGDWEESIKVKSDGSALLLLPVKARVLARASDQPTPPNKAAVFVEAPAAPAPVPGLEPPEVFNDTPAIKDIDSGPLSLNKVELNWAKPGPHAASYLVEWREITASDRAPIVRWIPWSGAKYREENGRTFLLLDNLPSGRMWYIRLCSLDEKGQRSAPSPTILIATRPIPVHTLLWWSIGLCALAAVIYGTIFLRKHLAAQNAAAESRLNRLGKI